MFMAITVGLKNIELVIILLKKIMNTIFVFKTNFRYV